MPPFSKYLEEEGMAVKSFVISEHGEFNEEGVTELLTTPSSSRPGVTGTRLLRDNISDLKA
jgi:5-oxoprolinase (ATP-hydrolysing)